MKYTKDDQLLAALLERDDILSVKDFMDAFGDIPMGSVYARIRQMTQSGALSVVGKGKYLATAKPAYRTEVSTKMKECNDVMISNLEGVNCCISERNGNLEVEVSRDDMARTVDVLRRHFEKVMYRKDAALLSEPPQGFVLVGRLISEAPLHTEDGVSVAAPEKAIVDSICNKEDASGAIQKILEVYPVNQDRLRRYASRRGVLEELQARLAQVDSLRVELFSCIQRYLSHTRIIRAWVFGSFARREENDSSDLDLLVDYDSTEGLSLLDIVKYKLDLEKLIGREVDLVENGYLKPFALPSAERDKYLIYER